MIETTQAALPADMVEGVRDLFTDHRRTKEARINARHKWKPNPRWDGGLYKGRRYPNIWKKIAEFGIEHEIYLPAYIKFVLLDRNLLDLPLPNQLLSPAVLSEFRNVDVRQLRHQIRLSIEFQISTAENRADWYADMHESDDSQADASEFHEIVLLDRSISLSPLFRYCAAYIVESRRICKKNFELAAFQYLPHMQHYDEIWGETIPDEFRNRARELYGVKHWLGYCAQGLAAPSELTGDEDGT